MGAGAVLAGGGSALGAARVFGINDGRCHGGVGAGASPSAGGWGGGSILGTGGAFVTGHEQGCGTWLGAEAVSAGGCASRATGCQPVPNAAPDAGGADAGRP